MDKLLFASAMRVIIEDPTQLESAIKDQFEIEMANEDFTNTILAIVNEIIKQSKISAHPLASKLHVVFMLGMKVNQIMQELKDKAE